MSKTIIDLPIWLPAGAWRVVRAEIVDVDFPGASFAAHPTWGRAWFAGVPDWSITQIETGLCAGQGDTITEAVATARLKLGAYTPESFARLVEENAPPECREIAPE
jgi:hypothetical protein